MWSWFGGASAQQKRKDAPKNAILLLREQLDMLQKREKHLENQMAEQEAVARKNVSANKNAAKAALRRKKGYEKNLEQTTAQVAQLEQQIYSIEAANINQETLNAMKAAGSAMSQIHKGMTIDKVDETMDKLREQHQLSEEVAQAITSAPIGEVPDEGELDEELEGLEQEAMDERMLNVPAADQVSSLPAAANGERELRTFQELQRRLKLAEVKQQITQLLANLQQLDSKARIEGARQQNPLPQGQKRHHRVEDT